MTIANYTGHGWEGKNYSSSLSRKEITARIRSELKTRYPDCKFSVTFSTYSGGGNIAVRLMAAKFDVFSTPDLEVASNIRGNRIMTPDEVMANWKNVVEKGYHQLNHYYLKDDYTLTDRARDMFTAINDTITSFRRDDSDGMIDYFDTNFYYDLVIGRWDKAFVRIN